MENWQFAQLSEEQLAEIRALENKLGFALIAYETEKRQDDTDPLKEAGTKPPLKWKQPMKFWNEISWAVLHFFNKK